MTAADHIATLRAAAQAAYKRGEPDNEAQRVAVLELERALRVLEVRRRRAVLWGAQARLDAMQARRALADIGHAAVMRLGNPRKAARFIIDAANSMDEP